MSLNLGKETLVATEKHTNDKEMKYPIRKMKYGQKLVSLLDSSQKILVVDVTHIGSKTLANLRKEFRGRARFLFGKNTLIRRVIRNYVRQTGRRDFFNLLPCLRGQSGLVFLDGFPTVYDMVKIQSEIVQRSTVRCAAKQGDIAPCDVIIRPMDTGLEPTRTTFFAAMNIATRINRGQIQIVNRVKLVNAGERVGASQAAVLHNLGMKPFTYGIKPIGIFDCDECYPAPGVYVDGLCSDGPTPLTVPSSVVSAYQTLLALGVGCLDEYSWPVLDEVKQKLCDQQRENLVVVDSERVEMLLDFDHEDASDPKSPSPPPVTMFDFGDSSDSDTETDSSESD